MVSDEYILIEPQSNILTVRFVFLLFAPRLAANPNLVKFSSEYKIPYGSIYFRVTHSVIRRVVHVDTTITVNTVSSLKQYFLKEILIPSRTF